MCGSEQVLITVRLSSSGHLFLTKAEADWLVDQIRQELACRIADQVNDLVMVADIPLEPVRAWELIGKLEDLLTEDQVDWPIEGF